MRSGGLFTGGKRQSIQGTIAGLHKKKMVRPEYYRLFPEGTEPPWDFCRLIFEEERDYWMDEEFMRWLRREHPDIYEKDRNEIEQHLKEWQKTRNR